MALNDLRELAQAGLGKSLSDEERLLCNDQLFAERDQIMSDLAELETARESRECRRLRHRQKEVEGKIIEINAGLVKDYVKNFTRRQEDEEEFEQAGWTGFAEAMVTYQRGKKTFASWARMKMGHHVPRAARIKENTPLSKTELEKLNRIGELAHPSADNARSHQGVADRARVDVSAVRRRQGPRVKSLDEHVGGDADAPTIGDGLCDPLTDIEEEVIVRIEAAEEIRAFEAKLGELSEREFNVVLLKEGLGSQHPSMTLREVGRALGFSYETARVAYLAACSKLGLPAEPSARGQHLMPPRTCFVLKMDLWSDTDEKFLRRLEFWWTTGVPLRLGWQVERDAATDIYLWVRDADKLHRRQSSRGVICGQPHYFRGIKLIEHYLFAKSWDQII